MQYYGVKITYKQLFDEIEACAKALCKNSVKRGDRVTIFSSGVPEVVYLILACSCYSKDEALHLLRDALATMTYEATLKHGTQLIRSEYSGDLHLTFCESRKQEYQNVSWTKDNWDEELVTYCKKGQELPKEVVKFVENVSVNASNAAILAPFLIEYERYQRYDLKQYLRQTWDLKRENETTEKEEKKGTENAGRNDRISFHR